VHAEDCRVVGIGIAEEKIDLEDGDLTFQRVDLGGQLIGDRFVRAVVDQPSQLVRVVGALGQRLPGVQVLAEASRLLGDARRPA
jgi:hypothetical protein